MPSDIPQELAIIMTDILPTGYSTAWNARRLADEGRHWGMEDMLAGTVEKKGICVVIGCGPVSFKLVHCRFSVTLNEIERAIVSSNKWLIISIIGRSLRHLSS